MKTESPTWAAFVNLRLFFGLTLCSFGLLLALAGLSQSATGTVVTTPDSTKWYVNGVTGSDGNDCRSPATACKTIGHAISLVASGDSIIVAAATYIENLTIGVSVKILGSSANKTFIGGGGGTVVSIPVGVQVTLSNFSIFGGLAAAGAGILNSGTLTLNSSLVTGNNGDGISNSGTLTINNSTLSGNLTNGFPPDGAGIYNTGILTINRSTLNGNIASGDPAAGGGIFNGGTLTINNSTISGNSAIIPGTHGIAYGGGIYNTGMVTVNNSTLSENTAHGQVGPGFGGNIYSSGGTAIFQNSIVANSVIGGNCGGTMTSNGYNLSSDSTCNFTGPGDLNNTDPMLGPLRNNGGPTQTMALLTGSPAIDAGNPGGCTDGQGRLLRTDQRGMPRPDHEDTSGCDMGAYESQSD